MARLIHLDPNRNKAGAVGPGGVRKAQVGPVMVATPVGTRPVVYPGAPAEPSNPNDESSSAPAPGTFVLGSKEISGDEAARLLQPGGKPAARPWWGVLLFWKGRGTGNQKKKRR